MKTLLSRLPIAFLLTGAVIRILGTGRAALWYDEAVTLYRVRLPLLQLWTDHSEQSGDVLLEMLLRPLIAISSSVWMLRLPSMLAGLACLALTWCLMSRLDFNPTQRTLTSFFVAFAPGLIWQAQDARVYSLLTALFLLALCFLLDGRWLAYGLTLAILCYCHNTAPAFVLAALLIALLLYPTRLRRIALTAAGVALAALPQLLLLFRYQQWITINIAELPPLTFNWFVTTLGQAFWASTHTDGLEVLLAALCLFLTLRLVFTQYRAHGRTVTAIAAVVPLAVIAGMSILMKNFFVYRVIIPLGIPFFLWLGWELGLKGWKVSSRTVLAGLWLLLAALGYSRFDPAERGGGLDQVAAEIRSQWRTGDALVLTTITTMAFDYYLNDKPMIYEPVSDCIVLQPPGPSLIVPRPPETDPDRLWIVIHDDVLLDDAAHERISTIVGDEQPFYEVTYMQTSPLEVYLVNNPAPVE